MILEAFGPSFQWSKLSTSNGLHSTVLFCTVLYCTVQYMYIHCVQNRTVLYCTLAATLPRGSRIEDCSLLCCAVCDLCEVQTRLGALVLAEAYHHQDYYAILGDLAPELAHARPAGEASARAGTGPLKSARFPHLHTAITMGSTRKPCALI